MKRLVFALVLVALLLALTLSIALASAPEYEDRLDPGYAHANVNGQVHMQCIGRPSNGSAAFIVDPTRCLGQ